MSLGRKLLNEKEVAEHIGCTVFAIRQYRRKKGLPFLKIGRLVRFKFHKVEEWIAEQQAARTQQQPALE